MKSQRWRDEILHSRIENININLQASIATNHVSIVVLKVAEINNFIYYN